MREGHIEQIGTSDDLYLRPETLFVASFIGSPPINLIEGQVENGKLRVGESTLRVADATAQAVTIGLRPEHLRFEASGLAGHIMQIEPMGREILYVVNTSLGPVRVLEAGSTAAHKVDKQVRLAFDSKNTLIFRRETSVLMRGAHFTVNGSL